MRHALVRNVNEAFTLGIQMFRHATPHEFRRVRPRGEDRLEFKQPYATTYLRPTERVLLHSIRDANPFFHLMESLWILAGREDVAWPAQWLPPLRKYSDNGVTFHGAYGARLNTHGQLRCAIERLRTERDSTRCALGLWQPERDAAYAGGDLPCNTTLYLQLREGLLDLTVCNRSNDLIWGAYGANAVQWSMLLEYVAACVGAEVGQYVQFSNNTHVYPDNECTARCLKYLTDARPYDPYGAGEVLPYPLVLDPHAWEADLEQFLRATDPEHFIIDDPSIFAEPFFQHVATPMAVAHYAYRRDDLTTALEVVQHCRATDWRAAAEGWLQRRLTARAAKREGEVRKEEAARG